MHTYTRTDRRDGTDGAVPGHSRVPARRALPLFFLSFSFRDRHPPISLSLSPSRPRIQIRRIVARAMAIALLVRTGLTLRLTARHRVAIYILYYHYRRGICG